MKARKQASGGTAFNDDPGKQIMDYDLRVCTWNIRTFNSDVASALLAKALIECQADKAKGAKAKNTATSTTAAMRRSENSGAGSWLAGDFDKLSQVSPG